ncbi:MAG: hypothetical protein DMF04_02685, partial [Verrucomicrobia bacterium]
MRGESRPISRCCQASGRAGISAESSFKLKSLSDDSRRVPPHRLRQPSPVLAIIDTLHKKLGNKKKALMAQR